MKKSSVLFLLFCTFCCNFMFSAIYFVSPSGSDQQDGQTWETSFQSIKKALSVTRMGDQIWVGPGFYEEGSTLTIDTGVSLFGGFEGGEIVFDQRKILTSRAIITGKDKHRCVTNKGTLDGFVIENGAADYGAGVYNYGRVENCIIRKNQAQTSGGGIDNWSGEIINCFFYKNHAYFGGGVYNNGSIRNCTFVHNSAQGEGAGLVNSNAGKVINSIFWKNQPDDTRNRGGKITYSCFKESNSHNGNLKKDPIFVAPGRKGIVENFFLKDESPCMTSGVPFLVSNSLHRDSDNRKKYPYPMGILPDAFLRKLDDPFQDDANEQ